LTAAAARVGFDSVSTQFPLDFRSDSNPQHVAATMQNTLRIMLQMALKGVVGYRI
jgi:hypothetical protein